jgi:ribonuclease Z
MTSVESAKLRLGDLTLEGCSRAGDETWFRVHPPGLGFDAGRGALHLAGARDLFLTHGHLDHALGVPFVLSQRSLHHSARTRVCCPREIASDLAAFLAAAARLERVDYDCELVPLTPGDRVEVGRDLAVEAFATDHVVPSLGYHLLRTSRRLAEPYRGLPAAELVAHRRRGVAIEEAVEEDWLSYCGDTGPAVFDREPRLFTTRVLAVECTFLGDALRDKGARYKHLHLDDLAERAAEFRNDALVLHHLSRRHTAEELRREVERRMPALVPRIHVFGGG